MDELITPKTCKEVLNEGMPTVDGKKGNLYVKFNIVFPTGMDF
jgi:DnaJ-class molecular chaperone